LRARKLTCFARFLQEKAKNSAISDQFCRADFSLWSNFSEKPALAHQ